MALLEPEKITGLILADTLSATRTLATIQERVTRFKMEGIDGSNYAEAFKSLCSKNFLASRIGRYFLNLFVEESRILSNASIIRCYEALASLDITKQLASIKLPTLVLAGTEDYAFEDTRLVAQTIPNAKFVPLDGLGHLTQLEDPALFNSIVLDFIRKSSHAAN